VIIRSVNEDEHKEVSDTAVVEEYEVTTSASSPVYVEVSVTTKCDAVTIPPDDHVLTSSPDDDKPPTVSEMCELQDLSKPSASSVAISDVELLQVSCTSGDSYSPGGLVAFCQSDTSAFTSVVTAKHVTSPVVVQGCDQRLRATDSARNSHSFVGNSTASYCTDHRSTPVDHTGYSEPDYEEPAPICSSQLSDSDSDSAQPSCGSDDPVHSSTGSPVSECDGASSCEPNSSSPSVVDESLSEKQSAICYNSAYAPDGSAYAPDGSAYAPDGCDECSVACYSPYIPVPVPSLPPQPSCYPSPVPGMTYPYPAPVPGYMAPMQSYCSPCITVIHSYPYPAYPVMPQPGMMPPAGMVPMAYPPYQTPPQCWVQPPRVMYRPVSVPFPSPMLPSFPR